MSRRATWAAALLAGLLAGCGATRPSKYYQLTIPSDPIRTTEQSPYGATLLIGPLRGSHLYREDQIVYSSNGEDMGTYQYQRWSEPPTEMLAEALLRKLRASGRYRAVEIERSNSRGDYILYGRLYDFKEISGPKLAARLTMDLALRDLKTGATVWTHYYTHDEPVGGKDITAVVAALDRCAQGWVEDIQSGMDQYFSSHPAN